MSGQLISLLQQPLRPRILVVGDVMLDRYLWGDVERISPEAPIPVLEVDRQEHRLGGVGSVASMLAALGAEPILATVVGDDPQGSMVRELLGQIGVDTRCVLTVRQRPTTTKERLLGRSHQRYPHHMMRVDRETRESIGTETAERMLSLIREGLQEADLVVLSDYDKGVCAGEVVPQIVASARSAALPVVADPARDVDYHRYAGCRCITPNRTEARRALGMAIATPGDGVQAARRMLRFGVEAALVTLDRDGVAWADGEGHARLFPCRPREVCDVTGAGDMVLSALGYALAAGADYPTAIELANLAGGMEVQRLGVVSLSREELLAELSPEVRAVEQKIVTPEELEARLDQHRQTGQRIVMTNGCFDLLHPGHVASLQEARRQGDCLVVGLNSDRSVRKLKGTGRPVINQEGRSHMLAALACVDYVVIFDETSVAGLVNRVMPDVLVKSEDYSIEDIQGRDIVESRGGRVLLVPVKPGYSTTRLIAKVNSLRPRSGDTPWPRRGFSGGSREEPKVQPCG